MSRGVKTVVALVAVVACWLLVARESTVPAPDLAAVIGRLRGLLADFAGAGVAEPAYRDPSRVLEVARQAGGTLAMSVAAMGLASIGALATIAPASRVLTTGELSGGGAFARVAHAPARGLHVLARAVPEFVWALLIVFVVRPGLLAGALALALHEVGVLGRLGADVVDDLPRGPLRALRSTGAGSTATVAYGVLPVALPQFVTFLLYRWEVVIRASVVVGFITAAGLGHELRLALSFRRWTDLGLILAVSVLMVWAVELVSFTLRRLAR